MIQLATLRRRRLTDALHKRAPYGETLHRDQRGIGTLLFAIGFLPFMLMFAVLVVDVGSAFALRRDLQTTADAAALAGVQELPENNALATAEAQANAALNTSGLTLSAVEITVDGFWNYLTVTVEKPSESLFSGWLNFGDSTITATATARVRVLNETPILLATDGGCGNALDITGTEITVDGGIQSHAGISVGGNGNTVNGGTTYGESCEITVNGDGHSFAPGPAPGPPASPPLDRTPFDDLLGDNVSLCDFSWPGDVNLNNESGVWQSGGPSGGVLEPGVYCAPNGRIQLSGSNVIGTVTFVADEEISLSGSNLTLTARSRQRRPRLLRRNKRRWDRPQRQRRHVDRLLLRPG